MVPQLFDMTGRESLRGEDEATALRQVLPALRELVEGDGAISAPTAGSTELAADQMQQA